MAIRPGESGQGGRVQAEAESDESSSSSSKISRSRSSSASSRSSSTSRSSSIVDGAMLARVAESSAGWFGAGHLGGTRGGCNCSRCWVAESSSSSAAGSSSGTGSTSNCGFALVAGRLLPPAGSFVAAVPVTALELEEGDFVVVAHRDWAGYVYTYVGIDTQDDANCASLAFAFVVGVCFAEMDQDADWAPSSSPFWRLRKLAVFACNGACAVWCSVVQCSAVKCA